VTIGQAKTSKLGRRVRFNPTPVSLVLYSGRLPARDEVGEVTTVPLPGGRGKYIGGPGGGLLYVNWPSIGTCGIAPMDLEVV
jgi:hypothetical protein